MCLEIQGHICIYIIFYQQLFNLTFVIFPEKDTMDVWVNGEVLETAVSKLTFTDMRIQ